MSSSSSSSSSSPSSLSLPSYSTLTLSFPSPHVLLVTLSSNPLNSMTPLFWKELEALFSLLADGGGPDVRCVIITGGEKVFSSGLDLKAYLPLFAPSSSASSSPPSSSSSPFSPSSPDVGRRALHLYSLIADHQRAVTALERCPQPVIGLIGGPAVGGAIDLLLACDVRVMSECPSSFLSVKEVDVGFVADVGTLQRLGKVMGNESKAREMCFTGRKVGGKEAKEMGLLSALLPSYSEAYSWALQLAKEISEKSPLVIAGTKRTMLFARDHGVEEGLKQVALMNAALMQSGDVVAAMEAQMKKKKVIFAKL